ncbi:Nucleoredoxin [Eumeta japonica]|uniref:Nucleoredoxin n=1 Tax=Eumeta variegata TaxID=151549 RepID=A0A4C1UC01_EUMVA|nr:Nucleoredoxin [Eumeta japonica]
MSRLDRCSTTLSQNTGVKEQFVHNGNSRNTSGLQRGVEIESGTRSRLLQNLIGVELSVLPRLESIVQAGPKSGTTLEPEFIGMNKTECSRGRNRERKRRLTYKYNIAVGVPTLTICGKRSRAVREQLLADPRGEMFPWPAPRLRDVLRDIPLIPHQTLYDRLPQDSLRIFYFAAHWCPPCRAFAPALCAAVAALRRRAKFASTQLILVSSDSELIGMHKGRRPPRPPPPQVAFAGGKLHVYPARPPLHVS